jgi:hypothetical protein
MFTKYARMAKPAAVALLCLLPIAAFAASKDVPQNLVEFAEKSLVSIGQDPVIVTAVAAQNAKGQSLERVKELDRRWQATPGIDAFMFELMRSRATFVLLNLQVAHPFITESLVMDARGALVGLTRKTSDYWQGDEAKFTQSFGTGAVHYSEVELDESTGDYLIQVSVVMKNGRAIASASTTLGGKDQGGPGNSGERG